MLTISVNNALNVIEKDNEILELIVDQINIHKLSFTGGKMIVAVMDKKINIYLTVYETKDDTLPDMSYFEYNDEEWSYQVIERHNYWFIEVYDEENEFVSYWGG